MSEQKATSISEYMESLKVGDEVIVKGMYGRSYRAASVTKTTRTQVHCGTEKFRKKDGYRIGPAAFDRPRIVLSNDDLRESVLRRKLETKLGAINIPRLSTDTLRKMVALAEDDLAASRTTTA